MKKKNGLLQTFFYDFLKIQVTNWVREILVTFENQSLIIYWFLLRFTVNIYKFTQGNLGAKKITRSRFQLPVQKKNRKLRHWRPTARSLALNLSREPVNIRLQHMLRLVLALCTVTNEIGRNCWKQKEILFIVLGITGLKTDKIHLPREVITLAAVVNTIQTKNIADGLIVHLY